MSAETKNPGNLDERLNRAGLAVVRDVIPALQSGQLDRLKDWLISDYGVQLWNQAEFSRALPYVDVRLKAGGVYLSVQMIAHKNAGNRIHEAWILKTSPQDWANGAKYIEFVYATAPDLYGRRTVAAQSRQFAPVYTFPDGTKLGIDRSNPKIEELLEVADYSAAFD